MTEFVGPATALSDADVEAVARDLGVEPAVIFAVDTVESAGAGFLPDGRPKILFEAHRFYTETGGRFGISNVSSPTWDRSLYGAAGAHQYDRLQQAIALDRTAALKSASWGRYQVMGFNYAACGYPTVEAFVAAMTTGERAHLDAFVAYCRANRLVDALKVRDWITFARGYNGAGQVGKYAADLAKAYVAPRARLPASISSPVVASIPSPTADEEIDVASLLADPIARAVGLLQSLLGAVGEDPGKIDGILGDGTLAAYRSFRAACSNRSA